MKKIVVFPFSPIFCALGSSTMPIVAHLRASRRIELLAPHTQAPTDDYAEFNEVVEPLEDKARKDFAGEGYDPDERDSAWSST